MKNELAKAFVATTLLAGMTTVSQAAPGWAKDIDVEKCKGIAKKGGNDCGANGHTCGGKAEKDNDPNEWVYLPKGVCEKITGGSVLETNDKK